MKYILFDGNTRNDLLPFTYTRPVAEIRAGILTLREKWERILGATCSCLTVPYLRKKFPFEPASENILINASLVPDAGLAARVAALKRGDLLMQNGIILAAWMEEDEARMLASGMYEKEGELTEAELFGRAGQRQAGEWTPGLRRITHPEDIFNYNAEAIAADFELITRGRASETPAAGNRLLGNQLFLEEGVEMECVNINTRTGPVYIGKGATIMEGVNLRGPLAICEGAVVKMGARLYGPTTIGPRSVVGGEIKQSVIFGYSNKSHDGYLGNSVIGEWCNFGADTNCSNMKNNYKPVKLWSYGTGGMRDTGLSYCGLMMGDFSRTGINTMFNTGTTVGVSVHVYGSAMPPVFIPDFSWGGAGPLQTYRLEKAVETASRIKEQKGAVLTKEDEAILGEIFSRTRSYRAGS